MAHEQTENVQPQKKTLFIPPQVIGLTDISQLLRELDQINEVMLQLKLRQDTNVKLPTITSLMNDLITANELNLLQEADRTALHQFLTAIKKQAPSLHMSFSSDPSQVFLGKLVTWLRQEINPYTLVTVGLQPNIGAGCTLRTLNKYFDLSLKESLNKHRSSLSAYLTPKSAPKPEAAKPEAQPPEPQPKVAAAAPVPVAQGAA
jgi:F0F1-type ATP synthase delta subunit